MDPNVLASMVFVFAISALGIVGGIISRRLKARDEQKAALGAANRELDLKVEKLERANAEMARRLENLETIVVSQTWSAVNVPEAAAAERPRRAAVAPHEVPAPAMEEMNRQRAEQLARRLGG